MNIAQPKPWLFPAAVLTALLVQALATFVVSFPPVETVSGFVSTLCAAIPFCVLVGIGGLLYFPLGLVGLFVCDSDYLASHGSALVARMWLVYLTIVVTGMIKPSRLLLLVLVTLLVLNVGGCWLNHVEDAIFSGQSFQHS